MLWTVTMAVLLGCSGGDDDDDDDSPLEKACKASVDCVEAAGIDLGGGDTGGGGGFDYDRCVEDGEAGGESAQASGCGQEYRDYVVCIGDDATCDESSGLLEGCDAEITAYIECVLGGTY